MFVVLTLCVQDVCILRVVCGSRLQGILVNICLTFAQLFLIVVLLWKRFPKFIKGVCRESCGIVNLLRNY